MQKKLLYITMILAGWTSFAQTCPTLSNPLNGSSGVPVETSIGWSAVEGVPGYQLTLGTTPGGNDIMDRRPVGNATSYSPPLGLPENTTVYVTVILFFFNRDDIVCEVGSFRTEDVMTPPTCSSPRSPVNGAININQTSPIVWNYVPKATGYRITVGTSTGSGDIENNLNVGNMVSYRPSPDLPAGTQIFVRIIPYNDNGPALGPCQEYSFTTGELATLPGCTSMVSPVNGETNVPLTPFLEWNAVPEATGYRVTIGSSPFLSDILNNVSFSDNSTFVIDFEANRTFFIRVVPYNSAGEAIGCTQESFSTLLGCGPFFDPGTGELVGLGPQINFPDFVTFCQNEVPYIVTTADVADGYRWFKTNISSGEEVLISENSEVALTEPGTYRYEAYNVLSQTGNTVECSNSKEFQVVSSEIPNITGLEVTGQNEIIRISPQVTGIGNYEYALNNIDGPYQEDNIFDNLPLSSYTVYVRDKNGCGIAQKTFDPMLTVEGFPKFFTPNGDGINDYWQVKRSDPAMVTNTTILVYDRYGRLLKQFEATSEGWDGTYNNSPLPPSDYWFLALVSDGGEIKGHFTLKR